MHQKVEQRYISDLIKLAYLAPDIMEAIIEGKIPVGLTLDRLKQVFNGLVQTTAITRIPNLARQRQNRTSVVAKETVARIALFRLILSELSSLFNDTNVHN